jgi:hypothetical protein
MKETELDHLLKTFSESEKKSSFDYEGYGVIDDLKLSKEELKQAFNIMWEICMVSDRDTREDKYLFTNGLIKSKDIFLEQFNSPDTKIPKEKQEKFKTKLQNVEPLVRFLTKIKEVL